MHKSYNSLAQFVENQKGLEYLDQTMIKTNIEKVLNCELLDTNTYQVLTGGYMNPVFTFQYQDDKYVYRYPGKGSEKIINRKSEYLAHQKALELNLDDSLLYIDEKGHKLSKYIHNYRYFNYESKDDLKQIIGVMKELHQSDALCGIKYDIFAEIENFYTSNKEYNLSIYPHLESLKGSIKEIYETLNYEDAEVTLCHNDIYTTNILITEDDLYLIDWEFAKDTHPALDLTTFIVCSPYSKDEVQEVLEMYLGSSVDEFEEEYYRYFAVGAFYWLLWALHVEAHGGDTEGFVLKYYDYLEMFLNKLKGEN